MKQLIVASNNKNKVAEFSRILSQYGYEVISQSQAGINLEVEENGTTFIENAKIKAQAIYDLKKVAVIADDSGLSVDTLDGAPGIYSARYGGEGLSDKDRYMKLLEDMENVESQKRQAHFTCAIHLILEDGKSHDFIGICEGKIGDKPMGENGFGYDPIFMVDENNSMAMIDATQKDEISHRGKALRMMMEVLG